MLDKHIHQRRHLTERVGGVIACCAAPYIFVFWHIGLEFLSLVAFSIVSILILSILLNRIYTSDIPKFTIITTVDLGLLFYSSCLGKEVGIQLLFFSLVCISFAIFNPKNFYKISLAIFIPIFSMLINEFTNYTLFKKVFIPVFYAKALYYTSVFVSFLLIIVTIYFYYRANEKAERKLSESNDQLANTNISLEEKNRDLVKKNNENQVLVESLGEMVKSLQQNEREKQKLIEDLDAKKIDLENQKAKTDKDIQAAAAVQKSIIPQEIPAPKEFEISYVYEAAKGLSGDFLDVVAVSNTKTVFVIGDITGKGIQASLKMAAAYPLFRTLIDQFTDLESLVRECNAAIYRFSELTQFIPCIIGVLDSEKMTFEFCNAGHSPGFIFSGLNVKELSSTGSPLGMEETSTYQVETIPLKKSDRIVLYTDGCTDIKNTQGERFSEKALVALLLEINSIHSETFTESVLCHLLAYKHLADLADDLTLLSIFVVEDVMATC